MSEPSDPPALDAPSSRGPTGTPAAVILAIGDEIILGQQLDTNSAWIADAVTAVGVLPLEHRTIPDDRSAIAEAITALAARADVVIVTGGLGPTEDDLTRDALGDAVAPGLPLEEDPAAVTHLATWFSGRALAASPSNRRQAFRPAGARMLPNPHGTAMGVAAELDGRPILCLPGPPREMQPMFHEEVVPVLRRLAGARVIRTAAVHQIGLGESVAAERLGALMDRDREPAVGTTASGGIVTARVRADGDVAEVDSVLASTVAEIERAWAPFAYGRDGDSLADVVGALLVQRGERLATAESCTGGLLGAVLVDRAGASSYFAGGWVVYSNEMKSRELGVPEAMIERHGAVSAPVAERLTRGAAARAGCACAIGITGVAGPDGGSAEKPVGTVFIGAASPPSGAVDHDVEVRRFRFTGDRGDVRQRSARLALQMLRLRLLGIAAPPLLWEVAADGERRR